MISVIVPVYNVEEFLEKCINSIINQSYEDLEIILVDDGSLDRSGIICDELASLDTRIRVIHKENGGLSSARNAGIEVANGEYISFIDSDDYIDNTMYETMLDAAKKYDKDIVCCGRYVDIWGKYTKEEFCRADVKVYNTFEALEELFYLRDIDVSACDKLYKRKVFDEIRYPEGKISEDAAVILDVINQSNGIVHVSVPFYHYVYRKNSISKNKYSEKRFDVVQNLEKAKVFVENRYPKLKKACSVYCALTAGSILLDMCQDKEAIKKYKVHYQKYRELFDYGFNNAFLSRRVNYKMKFRLVAVKTHTINVFVLFRTIYRKIKEMIERVKKDNKN